MKKILTILLGAWFMHASYSQYVLTCIAPPPQFSHDDLWNLTITRVNLLDNYAQFYIAMRIYNGQNQLEVKTNSATLGLPGVLTVINLGTIAQVQPFTINYYNGSTLQQVISSGGIFPPGTYNVDFALYGRPNDGEFTELAGVSVQVIVDALWPPMLLSPPDGDSIQTPNPVLTWTPAFSTYLSGFVTYRLRVTEIFSGQSKQQAISSNLPQHMENNVPMPLLMYPNTAQPLDTGKRYAWQVEGRIGLISLGHSEVWEFCYCFPQQVQTIYNGYYYKLTEHPQSQFERVKGNVIPVAFPEKYVPMGGKLVFRLKNMAGSLLADEQDFDAPKKIGLNKYQIDLCSANDLNIADGNYTFEFPTEGRQTYYLSVQLSERTNCP